MLNFFTIIIEHVFLSFCARFCSALCCVVPGVDECCCAASAAQSAAFLLNMICLTCLLWSTLLHKAVQIARLLFACQLHSHPALAGTLLLHYMLLLLPPSCIFMVYKHLIICEASSLRAWWLCYRTARTLLAPKHDQATACSKQICRHICMLLCTPLIKRLIFRVSVRKAGLLTRL